MLHVDPHNVFIVLGITFVKSHSFSSFSSSPPGNARHFLFKKIIIKIKKEINKIMIYLATDTHNTIIYVAYIVIGSDKHCTFLNAINSLPQPKFVATFRPEHESAF